MFPIYPQSHPITFTKQQDGGVSRPGFTKHRVNCVHLTYTNSPKGRYFYRNIQKSVEMHSYIFHFLILFLNL